MKKRRMWTAVMAGTTVVAVVTFAAFARAQSPEKSFDEWLGGFRAEARSAGVRPGTLDAAFAGVQPIPRVIELDRRQPEFTLTFREYMDRVVPQARIEKGRVKLRENRELLDRISGQYGVQARFLVAFWGIETDFGRVTGGFPVIAALATLAYDGRRSAYFRKELLHAVQIIDKGHVTPDKMVGSWAGAMGQTQFMPSTFQSYALDGDGDGRIDLWNNRIDVFASAANYLKKSGWRSEETWGRAVRLPEGFDRKQVGTGVSKTLGEWAALGVRRTDGQPLPDRPLKASVVLAEADKGPAYLVYDNYRTILKWNRSTFFAIAVGTLADGIGNP